MNQGTAKYRPRFWVGVAACMLLPRLRRSWGGPFNGQTGRRALFNAVIELLHPAYIVETGTFRGTTTCLMAEHFAGPIHTIESDVLNHGFSSAALRHHSHVRRHFGDSVQVLERLLESSLPNEQRGLFYLDAHWEAHLPLAEEIDVIARHCADPLILVDDFEVPGDPDYTFDDYGDGAVLNEGYLKQNGLLDEFDALYPALPGSHESSFRRGCVMLLRPQTASCLLKSSALFRRAGTPATTPEMNA